MISKSDHFEMCSNIWCTLLCTCVFFFGLVMFVFVAFLLLLLRLFVEVQGAGLLFLIYKFWIYE